MLVAHARMLGNLERPNRRMEQEGEMRGKIPFTEKPPRCPKCAGVTKRVYRDIPDSMDDFWLQIEGEFLNCACQSCGYSFPQSVMKKARQP